MLTSIFNFQALSILNLREREFREGDLKVLQNAFAKKLALGESSQVIILFFLLENTLAYLLLLPAKKE
jgi:hypothetical protein